MTHANIPHVRIYFRWRYKMKDVKMQDVKMMDQIAVCEISGPENARYKNAKFAVNIRVDPA